MPDHKYIIYNRMQERITYLLGAGASALAVPTIDNFKNRIILLCEYIEYLAQHRNFIDRRLADFYKTEYKWLINGIDDYISPDYFAKFLGETSSDSVNRIKLNKLKLLLSLFLICEQSQKIQFREFTERKYGSGYEVPSRSISNAIDPRYRVFWQDIFEDAPKRKLPDNINILTWNYDSQLELSLMEFTKTTLHETNHHLQIIPNINNTEIDSKKFSAIKLNGTAGVFYKKESNQILDGVSYFDSNSTSWLQIFKLFQEQISNANQLIEYPNFYFSWEKDSHPQRARAVAKQILDRTNKLVIIGYSFPDYNNKIDKELFHNAVNVEDVIIQALPADEIGIMKRFKRRFENPNTTVEFEPNIDRFFTY